MTILKIVDCPVCLDRLSPAVECCINGHPICQGCRRDMIRCPVCRSRFSVDKHTFITQLLDNLPFACKYNGCSVVRMELGDHEKFCIHRTTTCNVCPWTGKVKDLLNHVRQNGHLLGNCSTEADLIIKDFDTENFNKILMSEYYEQLFWRIQTLDKSRQQFLLKYICVPNEKVKNSRFVVKLEFEASDTKLTAEAQLKMNNETGMLENSFIFHITMLKGFENNDRVKYRFQLLKH